MGASHPQTPRCFLVLDYLFSSTRKLQFYVELALPYISLWQSRKVEFVGVVSCPPGVVLDEHHHIYRQIDDVAYCFHIALAESEGAGNGIFRV